MTTKMTLGLLAVLLASIAVSTLLFNFLLARWLPWYVRYLLPPVIGFTFYGLKDKALKKLKALL